MKKWVIRIGVCIVGVVVLTIASLGLMGLRENAGLSRSSIEINAAQDHVFQWIESPDKFKQWTSLVVGVESINPGVKGVGAKSIVLMNDPRSSEPIRLESVIAQYDPPTRFSANVTFPGLFDGTQTYELTDLGNDRTRVQVDLRIRYTSRFIRLLEPLVTPASTRKLDTDLASMKTVIEKTASAAAK